jgi:glycosyltransferase involved in cell wall biosynthesis
MSIRTIFRRLKRRTEPSAQSDNFNVFHNKTMASIIDSRGRPLGEWSLADADSKETYARFVLGVLRDQPKLRRRFPDATSVAGGYSDWLRGRGARKLRLSSRAISNIVPVFARELGEPVRDFYRHSPQLQARYPLALLPVGQKRFVKWLLGQGRQRHSLSDEQILWFLHQTAEDIGAGVVETYLINPDWQEQFPLGLVGSGQHEFLRWLRHTYPKFAPFRRLKSLPKVLSADEEAALRRRISTESDDNSAFVTHNDKQRRDPALGVNLLSHFCFSSGLGRAALTTKAALELAGVPLSCRDVPPGVDSQLEPRGKWLGLEVHPITILNVSLVPHFEASYRRSGLARRANVYRIAYLYWELERMPDQWSPHVTQLIDELWAPTSFVAQAMRGTMSLPVYDMLPGVLLGKTVPIARETVGIPTGHFVFLFAFDMCSDFERKNPLALIRAFRRAFSRDEPGTLVINLYRGHIDPVNLERLRAAAQQNRVLVIDRLVSREEINGFIEMCDCFVSLHRSEGFGLGLAEAMLIGKPVIGTNYSGNLAFMNRENSLLVDFELVETAESGSVYKKGFHWAQPSEAHAAELMRSVFENRHEAVARAERAKKEIAEQFSVGTAGQRIKQRLAEIRNPDAARAGAHENIR